MFLTWVSDGEVSINTHWDNMFANMLYYGHIYCTIMTKTILYIRGQHTIAHGPILACHLIL